VTSAWLAKHSRIWLLMICLLLGFVFGFILNGVSKVVDSFGRLSKCSYFMSVDDRIGYVR
jgi:hypothetical protein